MADATQVHRIAISVADTTVDGWTEYEISASMVEPADSFTLTRAWNLDVWKLCRLDARVRIAIDGVVQLDGFIDGRKRNAKANTMTIRGRDKVGRLVQTSIDTVSGFDGLTLTAAVEKLAAPEFTKVALSDARNRAVRRGKGGRAPAQGEPAIFNVKGKLDEEHAGKLDPGEMRWNVIEQLCTSVGLGCWSSGDGREIIIGRPNYKQDVQFLFVHSLTRPSTVRDIEWDESCQNRYAQIESFGSGKGGDDDYGEGVVSHTGTASNGPNADGTGLDFTFPKKLVKTQNALQSNAEAKRDAEREMKRRDFEKRKVTINAPLHGQRYRSDVYTLFAPNTLARVIDDELQHDGVFIIYEVRFRGSFANGETTSLSLVPRGTEFIA